MRKLFLLLFMMVITGNSFAQFSAYYPDGKKVTIKFQTIQELLDTLGVSETESYNHKLGDVYFKRLSNKPVFVFFFDKAYPLKIKEIISSYKYAEYLNSYSYYWDLKDMIKKGTLTKSYLQDLFKEPDIKGQEDDGAEYWIYKSYNAKITFEGDHAKSADVINYKAFQKNELSIPAFEVTGSDYSIGCNISFTNFSKKIIKYVFITITATNPVDDLVGTKIIKAVGPIKPSETASYEFDDVIYSQTAEYLTINNIKLQYMDGSIKFIPKNEVQNIRIIDWEEVGHRTE